MSIQVKDRNNENIAIQVMQFAGGERHVQIDAIRLKQLKGQVFIHAQINNSQDLMDYVLIENVLLNQNLEIHVEMPYFPYARQDRICATGQAFSLQVMTKLLNLNAEQFPMQRKTITVWDAHSAVTEKLLHENTHFFKIENVQPSEIILHDSKLTDILKAENTVLVCPDAGAKSRTAKIATAIKPIRKQAIELIYCEKKRDATTGKIMNSQVNATDLTGKTAVICDDICDGGATFIGIAEELKKLNCQHVILYVTHGIFSRGMQVFDGLVDQVFTTNSLTQQQHQNLNIIQFSRHSSH